MNKAHFNEYWAYYTIAVFALILAPTVVGLITDDFGKSFSIVFEKLGYIIIGGFLLVAILVSAVLYGKKKKR